MAVDVRSRVAGAVGKQSRHATNKAGQCQALRRSWQHHVSSNPSTAGIPFPKSPNQPPSHAPGCTGWSGPAR